MDPEITPRFHCLSRVVVVAEHERERDRRSQHDLADLPRGQPVVVLVDDGDLRPAVRMPDRAGRLVDIARAHSRTAFGVAVDVDDADAEPTRELGWRLWQDLAVRTGADAHAVIAVGGRGGLLHEG